MKTKIEIETSSYNDRRYGKPYIATLDFSTDPKGTATFGDWIGHAGQAGMLVIEAAPGTVLMKGQKDFRNSRNSTPEYGVVEANGTVEWCESKIEAIALARVEAAVATVIETNNPITITYLDDIAATLRIAADSAARIAAAARDGAITPEQAKAEIAEVIETTKKAIA